MSDISYRDWPFLDDRHRDHAARLEAWAARHIGMGVHPHTDVDNECRDLVRKLGEGGWLDAGAPADRVFDVRTLCLTREILARYSGLADFAFAMQGLGTGSITLHGSAALRARPDWSARFILSAVDREPDTVRALRDAAASFT